MYLAFLCEHRFSWFLISIFFLSAIDLWCEVYLKSVKRWICKFRSFSVAVIICIQLIFQDFYFKNFILRFATVIGDVAVAFWSNVYCVIWHCDNLDIVMLPRESFKDAKEIFWAPFYTPNSEEIWVMGNFLVFLAIELVSGSVDDVSKCEMEASKPLEYVLGIDNRK